MKTSNTSRKELNQRLPAVQVNNFDKSVGIHNNTPVSSAYPSVQ